VVLRDGLGCVFAFMTVHMGVVQSILDDGPPLRHKLHLPALLPQPVLKATSSTIVTRSCPP